MSGSGTVGPSEFQNKMHTRQTLMMAMDAKIKQARSHLSHGFHDPAIMEEIEHLSCILKTYIGFENVLLDSNLDID
jgi:hypothetical protein